jgi:hypothetical protein
MKRPQTDDELVADILKRFSKLKSIRTIYEPVWREITDFAFPRLSNWDLQGTTVVKSKGFNSRAVEANKLQSYGFLGYMVSRTKPWFRLRLPDTTAMRMPGVADWLEDVELALAAELARSNFYDQAAEFVPILGSIGTSSMTMAEDSIVPGRALFNTRHPKEYWIQDGLSGRVETEMRQFRMIASAAMQLWGDKAPEDIRRKAEEDPYSYVQILHAVLPREDWNPDSLLAKDKRFASYYIALDSDDLIEEGGFDVFPHATARWTKNADESYGYSPAFDALSDILRLNQVSRTQLELAQRIADPPISAPETMRDTLRTSAGAKNFRLTENERIEPLQFGANYPVTLEVEQNIEKVINEHFNVDFYLMLAQLDRQMTAREVLERKGEQSAVLGATIGAFQTEFLTPVISWIYRKCVEWHRLPPPPPAIVEAGNHLDIEYTGYLAQLQRKYYASSGISSALEVIFPIMQAFPESAINIDTDELIREAADAFGMPQKVIREIPEVQKIRQQQAAAAAQQQQQAMAMQTQQDVIKSAGNLNQPVQKGSPLAALLAQAQGEQYGPPVAP